VAILRGDGGAEGGLVAEGAASWAKPAKGAVELGETGVSSTPPHDLETGTEKNGI
jgi:hypothetical protein